MPNKRKAQLPPTNGERLIDSNELAAKLGVSLHTIKRLRDAGKLPRAKKVGSSLRWQLSEIDHYIAKL